MDEWTILSFMFFFGLFIIPIAGSILLCMLTKKFKFKKNDFNTALYVNIITYIVFIITLIIFTIIFNSHSGSDGLAIVYMLINVIVAIIAWFYSGVYISKRFYKESIEDVRKVLFSVLWKVVIIFIVYFIMFVSYGEAIGPMF